MAIEPAPILQPRNIQDYERIPSFNHYTSDRLERLGLGSSHQAYNPALGECGQRTVRDYAGPRRYSSALRSYLPDAQKYKMN